MNTIIVSAFPGTGKSYLSKKHGNVQFLDSDSSSFSWLKDEQGYNTKERNPEFPKNYIQHIKSNLGKVAVIFVSSHLDVRQALNDANINYLLFYPDANMKHHYLNRFRLRGNEQSFIDLLNKNWDNFLLDCKAQQGCIHIEMPDGYLSDYFSFATA